MSLESDTEHAAEQFLRGGVSFSWESLPCPFTPGPHLCFAGNIAAKLRTSLRVLESQGKVLTQGVVIVVLILVKIYRAKKNDKQDPT